MALPNHLSCDPGVQREAIIQDGVPTTSHLLFNVPVEMSRALNPSRLSKRTNQCGAGPSDGTPDGVEPLGE